VKQQRLVEGMKILMRIDGSQSQQRLKLFYFKAKNKTYISPWSIEATLEITTIASPKTFKMMKSAIS
jgi:hypothetical protein